MVQVLLSIQVEMKREMKKRMEKKRSSVQIKLLYRNLKKKKDHAFFYAV